jgi:DNA helicase-2/ATP-dependent DNA helicase PcrA
MPTPDTPSGDDSVREALLEGLNGPQRAAVSTLSGPLLVVAGPGSGKTRVLVHRIAALLEAGVSPWEILAVTFTNKAAAEMRDRVMDLVGDERASGMWISTFHSACVRILRREHEAAGLSRDFTILDDKDTLSVLKGVANDLDMVLETADLKQAANRISYAKNHGEGPDGAVARYRDERLGELFSAYQRRLGEISALDFDDLLLHAWQLLRDNDDVRERYQQRFRHVLVDEYQDTNDVQFSLVKLLAGGWGNLCVVGDLDQCHPAGTEILTTGGPVAVEDLVVGHHRLVSWHPPGAHHRDRFSGVPHGKAGEHLPARGHPFQMRSRHFEGDMLSLVTKDESVDVTADHRVHVRWSASTWNDPTATVLAVLRRGDRYRIGRCPLRTLTRTGSGHDGLCRHALVEGAQDAWVLDVLSRDDAIRLEATLSATHRLPTTPFAASAGQVDDPGDGPARARARTRVLSLLTGFGRDIRYPFWSRGDEIDGTGRNGGMLLVRACNVVSGHMDVPVLDGRHAAFLPVEVQRQPFAGEVYSLEVTPHHNYVANGTVVGNSVYSWRGSSPEIMATFTGEFQDAKVVVLEQNYRSTETILAVAQAVIDPNPAPWRARLWTENPSGSPVRLYVADDDRDEASFIVDEVVATGEPLEHHAVLVRTNAQTRVLEEELNRRGLPYQVVGALRFYDRAEIKDALAYLRVTVNPADVVSFTRCVNNPRRGIGSASVDVIADLARDRGVPVLDAARDVVAEQLVAKKTVAGLQTFLDVIDAVDASCEDGPSAALSTAVHDSGLFNAVAKSTDGVDRTENLNELLAAATRFADGPVPTSPDIIEVSSLDGREATRAFLENVTLVSAEDLSGSGGSGRVQILTAHSAKGKEFPHVFVAGLEQNLFPHQRSLRDEAAMAEERRLLFVACSRAEKTLTLTRCSSRMLYGGKWSENEPSVFLDDIDDLLEVVAGRRGRQRWRRPGGGRYKTGGHQGVGSTPWSKGAAGSTRSPAGMQAVDPIVPLVPATAQTGPRMSADSLTVEGRVRHRTFGIGVVESIDVDRGAARIRFGASVKELLLEYAPLEPA